MATSKEVMISTVITVNKNDTVKDVLKQFVEHNISGVPVVNEKNEPVGFISDGDIMKFIAHQDPKIMDFYTVAFTWYDDESMEDKVKELLELNVMKVASRNVIKVGADTEIDEVARVLSQRKIKKVPVVKDNAIIGIISRGDVVRYIAGLFLQEKS